MKYSFAAVVALVLSATSTIAAPGKSCEQGRRAIPLFRIYNDASKDHVYTTNAQETYRSPGYASQSSPGRVWMSQEVDTIPLYRLYNSEGTDHLYTTNSTEREDSIAHNGYTDEGVAAYIYPSPYCNSIPLYRAYDSKGADHFYSTDRQEIVQFADRTGAFMEDIVGYIMQPANH
ncbi:hypothetical protein HGRIS_006290 [Hohenbuehelia grisea]|uniref:DUF5648 domain-containing protein n=1 Tax=Hohenbuehelia grisea TaxID=104357 RepID=A0ABR3K278_9AGAR